MKKLLLNKWTRLAFVLLLGVAIGWLIIPHSNTESTSDSTVESSEEEPAVWTCSMHPHVRSAEPGSCPICGMDLIPLENKQDEIDPMAVKMSPTAMELAQVQTMRVSKGNAEKTIILTGKVQTDERLTVIQSSHIPGRIERLSVNFVGDYIQQGQEIARIYSPELVTAQQELLEANKIKESQPGLFNAAKEKLKNWKLNEHQIAQILATNAPIEQFPILADASGYVTRSMAILGDYVKQGEPLYEIANLSQVWVLFDVYESDLKWMKLGSSASFTVQSIPGKTFHGKISYIDPVINPKTHVAKARVEVNNQGMELKPEMFVTGSLQTKINTQSNTIVVPKSAVMWTGKRSVVYVMHKSDQGVSFIMRPVVLGPELGDSYSIESGLVEGEEIAVHGTFSIDAAAQLAGKPSMMAPEGGVAMKGHNHGGDEKK